MSFLRYSAPGRPLVIVDQGPNLGRVSFTRYGVRGSGEYIVAKRVKSAAETTRYKAREAQKARERRAK